MSGGIRVRKLEAVLPAFTRSGGIDCRMGDSGGLYRMAWSGNDGGLTNPVLILRRTKSNACTNSEM